MLLVARPWQGVPYDERGEAGTPIGSCVAAGENSYRSSDVKLPDGRAAYLEALCRISLIE
jgi:hypothetical protein